MRIGLALGEIGSGLVLPLPVLSNPGTLDETARSLEEIARGRDAAVVVIGDPVHMSGEASDMSQRVARLRDALAPRLQVPVVLRDERLSSVTAEGQLADAGLRWWQYDKGKIDTLAAMNIVRELLIEIRPELGRIGEEEPDVPLPRREKDQRRRDARKKRKK